MGITARFGLPLLSAGQLNKEISHNESLLALDTLMGAAVEGPPANDPPAEPLSGCCYLVGTTPTGEWAGQAKCLAASTTSGWRFINPADGVSVHVKSLGISALFSDGEWRVGPVSGTAFIVNNQQVVGSRLAAIANPAGGTTVDSQARQAIAAVLAALRQHGLIET